MTRTLLCLLLAGLAAGCVSSSTTTNPDGSTSTQSSATQSESGSPRARALAHTELASAYFSRGSMGVALEELRIATAADPTFAPAHGLFGMVYMELKENQLATTSFERALALAPTDPDINHNFGWFLCQTGKENDSAKYFMAAVRNPLYPTPYRSWSAAGVCAMKAKSPKEAEDYFQRALRLEPDEPSALLGLGQLRYQQKSYEEARRLVSRYNRMLTPTAESLWLGLRAERRLGERTAAENYASQLRRRFPASPEYRSLLRGEFD